VQKSRPLNQGEWHIKITLIHNPAAGDGSRPSGDDLVELLCAAGHKVNYQSSKEKKWKKALKKPGDIVAMAGGDGTVGKVARRLIGSPTPIAILPLGTANNIANTLDVTGKSLKELIRSWKTARCINFDAGVAKGPWGTESFVEGFGVGLFAETMTRLDGSKIIDLAGADDPPTVLRTVLKILRKQLKEHPAVEMTIRLDGKEMSGDYECPICRAESRPGAASRYQRRIARCRPCWLGRTRQAEAVFFQKQSNTRQSKGPACTTFADRVRMLFGSYR
jgi:diacylglycerol kinase family enzyme